MRFVVSQVPKREGPGAPTFRAGLKGGFGFVLSHPFAKSAKGWGTGTLQWGSGDPLGCGAVAHHEQRQVVELGRALRKIAHRVEDRLPQGLDR